MPGRDAKFDAALSECAVHVAVLHEALEALPTAFGADDVASVDSERRRLLDQLAYRFMKLQDSLGEKVLPGVLALTQDPLPPDATFAEKLNRLERLGAIDSAQSWRLSRETRDSLAHEYPDDPRLQAAALNRLLRGVGELLRLWSGVRDFTDRRLTAG